MLSKHITNVIQNLEKKKYRDKYNLFKVEGEKLVEELLRSDLETDTLVATSEWRAAHEELVGGRRVAEATREEMARVSNFQSPPEVLALARIPAPADPPDNIRDTLALLLNGIQDPGNMGTILRVCDWFGVRAVFCDDDCAGVHNPKTVQASMGAVFRIKVFRTHLPALIAGHVGPEFPCYGTFLRGDNIYHADLSPRGFVVMGNEGNGISPEIEKLVSRRLTIPSFAGNGRSAESLNVGVATGIVLSEFKRSLSV